MLIWCPVPEVSITLMSSTFSTMAWLLDRMSWRTVFIPARRSSLVLSVDAPRRPSMVPIQMPFAQRSIPWLIFSNVTVFM